MTKNSVCIIGHFGGTEYFLDGQTVKTKTLESQFKDRGFEISIVDTYYRSKKPLKLFFSFFIKVLCSKKIIVLLSGNGMKFFFPLLYLFSRIFKKEIYHDVIGGNLDYYVKNNKKFKKYLNKFKYNFVETKLLKEKLEDLGVNNCIVVPNFKNIKSLSVPTELPKTFKYCTFSRVTEEKGISMAIKAIEEVSKDYPEKDIYLDIYGPIDEEYKNKFFELCNNSEHVEYKGLIDFNNSVNVLSQYYCLLFPTFWKGEGFPGTILDAYFSGVPVLASDWNSNRELVDNNVTGVLFRSCDEESLKSSIKYSIENVEAFLDMRFNCLEESKKYEARMVFDKLLELMSLK